MNNNAEAGKTRVLFVDDDESLLSGLRRALRGRRARWQMDFVCGSPNALEFLQENTVDVVVSDVRMPEMDGAAFLAEVARYYPSVVRLVLSGQAEMAKVFSLVGIAHQYFAKPFSADVLYSAINSIQDRRHALANEQFAQWINRLPVVPVDLRILGELRETLESGRGDSAQLAEIMRKDPGISTRVLQLVNSCFFGPQVKGCTLEKACVLLGYEILNDLFSRTMLFTANPWITDGTAELRDVEFEIGRRICSINSRSGRGNEASPCPSEADFRAVGEYLLELWGVILPEGFKLSRPVVERKCDGMISPQVDWAGSSNPQSSL